jgi:hypothetical protein
MLHTLYFCCLIMVHVLFEVHIFIFRTSLMHRQMHLVQLLGHLHPCQVRRPLMRRLEQRLLAWCLSMARLLWPTPRCLVWPRRPHRPYGPLRATWCGPAAPVASGDIDSLVT